MTPKGYIHEGMFDEDLNGFGRAITCDGAYYLGFFNQAKYEGLGKYVFPDGFTKEGLWKNNVL